VHGCEKPTSILIADKVSKTYHIENREMTVLDSVSLAVGKGDFLVVEGRSGSGKTTLLSLLSGLDKPSAGRIIVGGRDITDFKEDELAPLRNVLFGFVFQSFHLVPALTALENVMFPAEIRRDPQAEERARSLLQRVGMSHRTFNFPHQLSGGEMQRVAICRAVINHPQVIFADEPTGNLDSESGRAVLDLLLDFHREKQTTLVMATHNREISALADRIVRLKDGHVDGSRQEIPIETIR
jgi:putative ABC transport system ATP-binding protein